MPPKPTQSARARDPIGVFDSGLGGLTLVKAIRKVLPGENLIYFGDLARLPYGTKSRSQIQAFSVENTQFLLDRGIKALVIACNSSASAAGKQVRSQFSLLPVVDVIEPAVHEAIEKSKSLRIGMIATCATVESGVYEKFLRKGRAGVQVFSKACPLFVPLVEEGMWQDAATDLMIRRYVRPLVEKKIDTLILGCTHYPLLIPALRRFLPKSVHLVDSALPTALKLKKVLLQKKLQNPEKNKGKLEIFVSDKPRQFTLMGQRFLGERLGRVTVVRR